MPDESYLTGYADDIAAGITARNTEEAFGYSKVIKNNQQPRRKTGFQINFLGTNLTRRRKGKLPPNLAD